MSSTLWFHGTKFSRWALIQQMGLDPYPDRRAWDFIDNPGSFQERSLASAGGVYLTRNLLTAYSAASNGNHQYDDSDVVLLTVAPTQKLILDEDMIAGSLAKIATRGCLYTPSVVYWLYLAKHAPGKTEWAREESRKYLADAKAYNNNRLDYLYKSKNPRHLKALRQVARDSFDCALNRAVAWAVAEERQQQGYRSRYWDEYLDRAGVKLEPPNPHEAEQDFSEMLDWACDKLSFLLNEDPQWRHARCLHTIGWDEITCAMRLRKHQHGERQQIELLHGDHLPHAFLSQWQERMGYEIDLQKSA